MPDTSTSDHLSPHVLIAREVIQIETQEIQNLIFRLNDQFSQAIDLLNLALKNERKIVICGIGKSGNIAHKLAATLNSTGAPSVVLNAQNALHGDLGILSEGDPIITLSYSGETSELLNLLPHFKRSGSPIISFTGNVQSSLAQHSDLVLDCHVSREACPLNLAPTSSTTVMLVMADALAMSLLHARGFRAEDFARFHPGGSLGRKLLTKVADVMRPLASVATAHADEEVSLALRRMIEFKSGATIIVSEDGTLGGIFTQGDFVRAFQRHGNIANHALRQYMTPRPLTIQHHQLAAEIIPLLKEKPVDDLIVIDDASRPIGLVDSQDLSRLHLI